MIVNIYRENCSLKISNLPYLRLHGYEVCVRSIYAEFYDDVPNGYVTLSSSLVDSSSLNPEQEILSFYNDSYYGKLMYYKQINFAWYPLKTPYIDENTIDFKIAGSNVKTIKKLHLQIEFSELE